MARDSEMREFTRRLFRGRPDLSALTHSIVRQRFLAHVGRDHLEVEEKQALKRLVEEELLRMQVDDRGARGRGLSKKVKRAASPSSDSERKKPRFNSESELSSAASSSDSSSSPAENGMAEAEASPAKKGPKQTSKKSTNKSRDEEASQRDQTAKMGSEEGVDESSEEEEEAGSARKATVRRTKQKLGKAAASRKQAVEESEDSEEEAAPRRARKQEGEQAKSHQESEEESEAEDASSKKRENREDEEDSEEGDEEEWTCKAKRNRGERLARDKKSVKLKNKAGKLMGNSEDRKDKEAAGSGDETEGEEEPSLQKVSDKCKGREKQSGSSEEDVEDSGKAVKGKSKGTKKAGEVASVSGEESDVEREVSDSEAEESPQGERRNRSSKKSAKKGKTRSSSSSSDESPEPEGRKAVSGRRGEDHPAIMRLKRYIRACGAYRNYKKLLGSCHSHKERLSVLRAELEALGMKGNPSLEKCRALKQQREEAAEVASLDVANIISSSGRSRRRTAWNPSGAASQGELYHRTLDSEEEQPRRPPLDWSHMRGIISSDGEST
ncbi:PREDICTED: HIRA-interacting protein 3 [Elephantulus edwardii]|uniref:HIRA-interacting protein 3 n=1 Tax=Elephantulus edwardii TaxID=28737 RepID=UPI0003F09E45|nr:PREDICTED: HIRA-interacting protein 3 [Elephantulus edwardii]